MNDSIHFFVYQDTPRMGMKRQSRQKMLLETAGSVQRMDYTGCSYSMRSIRSEALGPSPTLFG